MGGDLPCRHGEAAFYLVSLAQHTGVNSGSSTAEGYVTLSLVSFGHFCPCEGITVNKFKFKFLRPSRPCYLPGRTVTFIHSFTHSFIFFLYKTSLKGPAAGCEESSIISIIMKYWL
jgi:hypothetical protein